MTERVSDDETIYLPDGWHPPGGTLEELIGKGNPLWFTIMNFVCLKLSEAGNDEKVLVSYRDQAMAGSYRRLVRVSAVFMGEIELEHDSPTFV
jgi:hypothetical protein